MPEYLMLAHRYEPARRPYSIGGWYWSEKLDGHRAFWDGGRSRGWPVESVPYLPVGDPPGTVSTGLWTRGGHVVHAPAWYLDSLPAVPLDGELYIARNTRPELASIVEDRNPGPGWSRVRFLYFDSPQFGLPPTEHTFMRPRFDGRSVAPGAPERTYAGTLQTLRAMRHIAHPVARAYVDTLIMLRSLPASPVAGLMEQTALPHDGGVAADLVLELLRRLTAEGAEGLMLRHPRAPWENDRCWSLLKVKTKYLNLA